MTQRDLLSPYEVARRGRYFRALNPTMGTGIAMGIQTTFSDTANVLLNFQQSAPAKEIHFDYLRLICTAAGASTTASDIAIVTDNIARYSTGGTALTVKNASQAHEIASTASVAFGAVTANAASAKRQLSRLRLKTQAAPCWTVGDQVFIKFGGIGISGSGSTNGSATQVFSFDVGPVILPAVVSAAMCVHMWNTANATTPPSWEVELGWWEI